MNSNLTRSQPKFSQLRKLPVSMPHVLKFAALFVAIAGAGTLAHRYFGTFGFLALSVIGGLVAA
jgi:uncharacterized membrane protein (DUF4010 family)